MEQNSSCSFEAEASTFEEIHVACSFQETRAVEDGPTHSFSFEEEREVSSAFEKPNSFQKERFEVSSSVQNYDQKIEINTVSKNVLLPEPIGYITPSIPTRPPPKDKLRLVWLVFILNSGGFWLAWNLINFLGPTYYFDYWFSTKYHIPIAKPHSYGEDFLNAMGMLACSPLFALGYVALIPISRVSILLKYLAGLAVYTICILILFIATCTWKSQPKDVGSFFTFSVTVILIMMGGVGACQSFLYGMAADFPRIYTSAIVMGTNLGGILASLLYAFINPKLNGKHNLELQTAKAFYGITFGFLVICCASIIIFWKSNFYWHFMEEASFNREAIVQRKEERFSGVRQFLRNFAEVFCTAWVEFLGIFMIFFTMYAIFPTLSVGIQPHNTPGQSKLPTYFLPIGTFLNFYTFATLGAIASMFIKFPIYSKTLRVLLLIPCYLSMYLIVFFMFCNFYPNPPKIRTAKVIFKNEWYYYIANGFLGLLTGILSGILMPLASRVVKPEHRQLAGQMALASLLTGLYLGAGMTPGFISALTVVPK